MSQTMSVSVRVPGNTTELVLDAETIVVAQLNALFRKSGLHRSTASTQLHIMPEAVYVLTQDDVAVISHHAKPLVTCKGIQCDFSALCGVLWGHAKDAENIFDKYLQQGTHVEESHRETGIRHLLPYVITVAQVFHTLRHIEEPFARQEVRDAVNIVQKDVEMVVRMSMKLARILDNNLKHLRRSDKRCLCAAELALGAAELFAATISMRNMVDISAVLSFFNSDIAWRLSGVGIISTEGYCDSIRRLICSIFARQRDFTGVEQVAVHLLIHRLADRPPFEWKTFQYLFYSPGKKSSSTEVLTPQYGVLSIMSTVQTNLEALLLANELWTKSLRRECGRELREMNEKKKMLSFYQVPILGILQGMPRVDLCDDAQLHRRATVTQLCTDDNLFKPNFLRILLAHGYTVPHDNHTPLNNTSVLALFRAISEELFQISLIKSEKIKELTDIQLKPPLLISRVVQIVVNAASSDAKTAQEILNEIHNIAHVIYDINVTQCATLISPKKIPEPLRRLSVSIVGLLFNFFQQDEFISNTNHRMALESLTKLYAIRTFFVTADANITVEENKRILRLISKMQMSLVAITKTMTASEINTFFNDVILPSSSEKELKVKNRLHYALVEAYLRAFAFSGVALAMDESIVLRHWVSTSLRCMQNKLSAALGIAALDFFTAVFLSKRAIAPLFVPTYVAVLIPISSSSRYGEPPLFLVRHFAKTVRSVCQALEECNEQSLERILKNPKSSVKKLLSEMYSGSDHAIPSMDNARPISCLLLIVSTLFDKACLLLGYTEAVSSRQDRLFRFQAYFSALINLLRCHNSTVLHRVCASVEAIILEHLHGVPSVQVQWMKYISSTVDTVQGTAKKEVAEWYLKLAAKVNHTVPLARL
ncbi:putative phosphoribosylpyrophosphate synthetase [Trypanosoma theileri]|uniref:Putative phosphoribosylpyrophosphate synthetase n=1 Tax=Trypanosoma theileri TaxID=67003 RepID=A0A1X0P1V5_9TRYP|nr:putative phosphoribosylpyrophosphate synthetase [Trypanosoma theileri]ORC90390.1 putative phosphoribosylpyrophosphate synthetase [Trypanosoma theileri]